MLAHTIVGDTPMSSEKDILRAMTASVGESSSGCNGERNEKKGPLYLQIKNIIRDRILHGVYAIHTNIPSEPQLEEEFKVSKITVRNAIKELAQEGYLEKKSGKGTKVIRNTSTTKLSKGKKFTEVLVEEGYKVQKRLLKAEIVQNEEGTVPFRLFGKESFRIERLYTLNDAPYIHYTHYFRAQEWQVRDLSEFLTGNDTTSDDGD